MKLNKKLYDEWMEASMGAFTLGQMGRMFDALDAYTKADNLMLGFPEEMRTLHCPYLSSLRHMVMPLPFGFDGLVECSPVNEDHIVSLAWHPGVEESDSYEGLFMHPWHNMESNIRKLAYMDVSRYQANLTQELPHVQVLSPGRSGTVGLDELLRKTHYVPYHSYIYCQPIDGTYAQLHSILTGEVVDIALGWLGLRAAEWIGPTNIGRPMAAVNHLDTIFAPMFAAVHPKAKFLYLKRDPYQIFKSFWTKNQVNPYQIQPVYTGLIGGGFHWKPQDVNEVYKMAWYIRFHEEFGRAMGQVFGDRYLEVSAEKLFDQDLEECLKLQQFMDLDLTLDEIQIHYEKKINEKAHKATRPMTEEIKTEFNEAYIAIGEDYDL